MPHSRQKLAHPAVEQGNALIVTIVTVAIVSAIAATALLVTTSKFGTAFQAASWQESLQGAEAAADLAMAALNTNTWTGWYNVNGTPTSTQPTGGTAASGVPANGTFNYYIPPTLTHVGEGNSNVKMWVTVDGASGNLLSGGQQWYRIRGTGVCDLPGGGRVSTEKLDGQLRKLSLKKDRFTGAAVAGGTPYVRRTVEIIAKPNVQSLFVRGLTLKNAINMSGSGWIDSFDSSNPFKSTGGLYDVAKRQSNGDIGSTNSTGSDLKGTYVYGDLTYSGPPVANTTHVTGTISTPFSQTIPPVPSPAWTAGTYNATPTIINNTTTLNSGTKANPAKYKVSSLTVSGGKVLTLHAANTGPDNNYIEIWVTGAMTTSGSGYITQDSDCHVTYHVEGDITVSGSSFNNQSNVAANMTINAITPASGTTKVTVSGSGVFIGVMNAPNADVTLSGSANFSGAFIANSINISGGASLHYDEALAGLGSGGSSNYSYASWIEDTR